MDYQSVARKLRKIAQEIESEETEQHDSNIEWQSGLPQYLRGLRKYAGLSLTQLHEQSGVSRSYLHLIEKGESEPTVAILSKVLAVYGLKLEIVPIE